MPTLEDLGKLATELYGVQVGAKQDINDGLSLDTSKASSMGFTGAKFYVWSGKEVDRIGAFARRFYSSATRYDNGYRRSSKIQTVCLGE